jgi:hypothetical protein
LSRVNGRSGADSFCQLRIQLPFRCILAENDAREGNGDYQRRRQGENAVEGKGGAMLNSLSLRPWSGWTLNFAHRSAWLVLLGAMVIAVAPTLIVVAAGYANTLTVLAAVALSIVVLSFGAAWESERRR